MKRKPSQKPIWMSLLLTALVALLPLLAILQYRWLGQVSDGERERMKSNLLASARQFSQDFDNELTNIYILFQQGPASLSFQNSSEAPAQNDFSLRYQRWRKTAARPGLIKEIYQTQIEEGDLRLARFNPATNVFELCEWPDKLSELRKTLNESRLARDAARRLLSESFGEKININLAEGGPVKGMVVRQFDSCTVAPDLPGLIIPYSDPFSQNAPPLPGADSFRIVALDLGIIQGELIPDLLRRNFGGSWAGEYNIAVASQRRKDEVIYSSNGASNATTGPADVTADLFNIRDNDFNRFFRAHLLPAGADSAPKNTIDSSRRKIVISLASKIKTQKSDSDKVASSGPVRAPVAAVSEDVSLSRNVEGGWRLLIKHRAGSLDAAVTKARHRNLAISFGILLLLGVSVGFIMLSSRRAERLATQQMEFVAGVSHELRTPLAVICSAAENLADGVIDQRDQIQRYGGLIRDEGRRLTGMVEQVLEFAGAQSGRKTYELRPTELNRVIEDALAASHLQLVNGGFAVEKKIAANLPTVNADSAALSRAIQNLLSNAMKYSGESRWIGLSAELVKTADGDHIRTAITDRGLGVPTAEQDRIFEPFYRGRDATAAQIHGNGLGLSLVKHIVTAHGGRVSVESKIGQGSVFTLTLPAAAKARGMTAAENSAKTAADGEMRPQFTASQPHSGD
jgi:signal transduction histidine kinase